MSTELFNARAKDDGHTLAVALDHHLQPETCFDSKGAPYQGYNTWVKVFDGDAITEAVSSVEVKVALGSRGAVYAGIAAVLRHLGVDIPDGWRSHELPPGMVL